MDPARLALTGGAALAAGFVNAIAGGGSLISFPALVAAGLPSVTANVTNTVALCPGYFGGTFAQRRDLVGQGRRMAMLTPVSAVGGIAGAMLLLATGERAFDIVVPFLLLFAVALLTFQNRLHAVVMARRRGAHGEAWAIVPVGIAAVYGGYFGAALGVIVLAALDVVVDDSLIRLNALKQVVSLAVNVSAAAVFLLSGRIEWTVTLVMAMTALTGGAIGGAIASRVPAKLLRAIVIVAGLGLSAVYFARLWRSHT
jgi:uncharacterized membrane protein YfcA